MECHLERCFSKEGQKPSILVSFPLLGESFRSPQENDEGGIMMGNFLEYRPQLEYKRRLQAILTSFEEEFNEDVEDAGTFPPEEPPRIYIEPSYTPSETLQEAIEITPTDVLTSYSQAKQKVETLINKIVENLKSQVTISPSIDEYIKAKEENDMDVVYAFEEQHSDHLEGLTEAEVLPILLHFQEELETLESFIGPYLFPDALSHEMNYLIEHIDHLRQEEEATLKHWVELEQQFSLESQQLTSLESNPVSQPLSLDIDEIRERNHILYFLFQRMDALYGFAEEVESILEQTPSSLYHESGDRIFDVLTQQSQLRGELAEIVEQRFERHRKNAEDAYRRMIRLVSHRYKRKLLEESVKWQNTKLRRRSVVELIQAMNPHDEGDPMNLFFMNVLEEIESSNQLADSLVEDLYKVLELERLQMIDYLVSLEGKHQCRILHQLLSNAS